MVRYLTSTVLMVRSYHQQGDTNGKILTSTVDTNGKILTSTRRY